MLVRLLRGLPHDVAVTVDKKRLRAEVTRLHGGGWDADTVLRMVMDRSLTDGPVLLARLGLLDTLVPVTGEGTYVPDGPLYVGRRQPEAAARWLPRVRAEVAAARSRATTVGSEQRSSQSDASDGTT